MKKSPIKKNSRQTLEGLLEVVQERVNDPRYQIFPNLGANRIIAQPAILRFGKLQPHQLEALDWMVNLASRNCNALLADDMGLGKTIQAISYLAYLWESKKITGKHLIVCPKTVCSNWLNQLKNWLPCMNVHIYPNTKFQRQEFEEDVLNLGRFNALITNFEGMRDNKAKLMKIPWEVLIIDEAHKLRNANTIISQSAGQFEATFKLLLTGTPLNNSLDDMWTLLKLIMPDIFSDSTLIDDINQGLNSLACSQEEIFQQKCEVARLFNQLLRPFMKRRNKETAGLNLPPKIEKTLFVSLSPLQLRLYRNLLTYKSIYGLGGIHEGCSLVSYRKICMHPYLFEGIADQNADLQTFVKASGKMTVLDKLLLKFLGEGRKVLVFSQYVTQLCLIAQLCQRREYKYCFFDGQTSLAQREQEMKKFREDPSVQIFLLSTRAGGLGVNLVTADRVIINDIDWNPQNDYQAQDRAYRIGQTKEVHVYKLITEHTIEERMLEVQKYKLVWNELILEKGMFVTKKNDPLINLKYSQIALIGIGEIHRLNPSEDNRSLEEIISEGREKDQKKYENMKMKLLKHYNETKTLDFNPFEGKQVEAAPARTMVEEQVDHRKERRRFLHNFQLPPYNCYRDKERLAELHYRLHLQTKKPEDLQCKHAISSIKAQIEDQKSRAEINWSEEECQLFILSSANFARHDYQGLHSQIKTKTPQQIENFSSYFFRSAPTNPQLKIYFERVLFNQKKYNSEIKIKVKEIKQVERQQKKKLEQEAKRQKKIDQAEKLRKKEIKQAQELRIKEEKKAERERNKLIKKAQEQQVKQMKKVERQRKKQTQKALKKRQKGNNKPNKEIKGTEDEEEVIEKQEKPLQAFFDKKKNEKEQISDDQQQKLAEEKKKKKLQKGGRKQSKPQQERRQSLSEDIKDKKSAPKLPKRRIIDQAQILQQKQKAVSSKSRSQTNLSPPLIQPVDIFSEQTCENRPTHFMQALHKNEQFQSKVQALNENHFREASEKPQATKRQRNHKAAVEIMIS